MSIAQLTHVARLCRDVAQEEKNTIIRLVVMNLPSAVR